MASLSLRLLQKEIQLYEAQLGDESFVLVYKGKGIEISFKYTHEGLEIDMIVRGDPFSAYIKYGSSQMMDFMDEGQMTTVVHFTEEISIAARTMNVPTSYILHPHSYFLYSFEEEMGGK